MSQAHIKSNNPHQILRHVLNVSQIHYFLIYQTFDEDC